MRKPQERVETHFFTYIDILSQTIQQIYAIYNEFRTIDVKVWCNTKRGGYSKMI
jgi:hypothetical protein